MQKLLNYKPLLKPLLKLFLLSVFLPPVAIVLLWKNEENTYLKIGFSALATISMVFMFSLINIGGSSSIKPVPTIPDYLGYNRSNKLETVQVVSEETVPNYSFNYQYTEPQQEQTQSGLTITYQGQYEDPTAEGYEKPLDPASLVTLVYTVSNNPSFYHMNKVCDSQTNNNVLILEDAVAMGLLPCPKCCE